MTASRFYGWKRERPAKARIRKESATQKVFPLALLVFCAILAGCVPKEVVYSDPILALDRGQTVNVSQFNSANCIYTMFTAQPSDEPEANEAPSTFYPYTFTATAGIPSQIAPSLAPFSGDAGDMPYAGLPTYQGQAQFDRRLRAVDNMALASRARQVSRQTATRAPIAPVITVGTTWDNVFIAISGNSISTTCQYVSNHAYFFVDNRDAAAMSSYLASYGTAFDSIYTVNRNRFGTENDIDGYDRVIVVFSQELALLPGLLGYFYSVDKFPNGTLPGVSNEGDIFYITTDPAYQGDIIKGTLAHEFQHMIYFDRHYYYGLIDTYTWLNEALSQAAEYYNGYTGNHDAWIGWFLNGGWEGLSLTHWTLNNYGYGAVFIRYLIDQYGDAAIKNMCSTRNIGVAAVELATRADFTTIFNDFTRALVMSGTGDTSNPRYNFKTLNLQAVQPGGRGGLTTPYSFGNGFIEGTIPPYMPLLVEWTGDYRTMTLSGASIVGTVFGLSR